MLRLTLFGSFSLADASGAEIALSSRKARALLAYLALSPGLSRSREEIMALLWSDRGEAQARGSLRQVLSGLRKKLGEAEDVLRIDNDKVALDPGKLTVADSNGQDLLAGFHLNDAAFEEWLRDERLRLETAPPKANDGTTREMPDIAVLPFENMSKLPEQDAFSEGITEDILTELARFSGFTVYSPWSSFHYDDEMTTEQIAQEQEIDYVLEGSMRRSGNRVRITAMLFDAETVNHVWVQRFDRDLGDEFAVQDEVAKEITTAVSAKIETDAYEEAVSRSDRDRSAFDYVLLGERAQREDWAAQEAVAYYEKAIALDTECARAYANLANWHACSSLTHFVPEDDAYRKTRELGETALNLAPKDAIVLAILGDAYAVVGDTTLSRQCMDKAIRQNPNHHSVMIFAASTFAWQGEAEQSLQWLERYLRHDPLWTAAAMEVCLEVYYLAGRFDEAVATVARWTDLPLNLLASLAAAHAQTGRLDEAAELRALYEAGLPEGRSFEDHILGPMRLCHSKTVVDRWVEGFAKAGFAV